MAGWAKDILRIEMALRGKQKINKTKSRENYHTSQRPLACQNLKRNNHSHNLWTLNQVHSKNYTGLPHANSGKSLYVPFPSPIPQLPNSTPPHTHTLWCSMVSFFCVFTQAVLSAWNSLFSSSTFRWLIHPLITTSIISSSWELDAPTWYFSVCMSIQHVTSYIIIVQFFPGSPMKLRAPGR